jgi:hypothetical protein
MLTGCAELRPGEAARVGDNTLATSRVDDFASAYCTYTATAVQPGAKVSRDIRNQALSLLVEAELAHEYAADNDLTWDNEQIQRNLRQLRTAAEGLPADQRSDFLAEVRYVLEGSEVLGQAIGDEVTDQESFNQARAEVVGEWSEEYGVEINPRFGEWDGATVDGASGSLSVPESEEEGEVSAADLPASQTCE